MNIYFYVNDYAKSFATYNWPMPPPLQNQINIANRPYRVVEVIWQNTRIAGGEELADMSEVDVGLIPIEEGSRGDASTDEGLGRGKYHKTVPQGGE